jgi:hypothetical protein
MVFMVAKSSRVICLGCQLTLKNLITNAKMSCAPFDIQRTKLIVEILHLPRLVTHIIGFFFPTNLNNIPYENYFLKGKTTLGHKSILKHFNWKLKAIDF